MQKSSPVLREKILFNWFTRIQIATGSIFSCSKVGVHTKLSCAVTACAANHTYVPGCHIFFINISLLNTKFIPALN